MNNVAISPDFLLAVEALLQKTQMLGLAMIPVFLMIVVFNQVFAAMVYSSQFKLDAYPIVRGIALLIAISFYQDFMDIISATVATLVEFIGPEKTFMQKLSDMWNLFLPTGESSSQPTSMQDLYQSFTRLLQFDLTSWLLALLEGSFVHIVRKGIELIRLVLLGFLFIVGPLALGLSVIPGFGQLALKWFQNYLTVQFWSVTLIILDTLVSQFNSLYFSGMLFSEELSHANFVLIGLVIVILYFMVPHLTSYIVGQSHAAVFQSRVFSTALLAAGMAIKGGQMAAKGGQAVWGAGTAAAGKTTQAVRHGYDRYQYQQQFKGGIQPGKTYEL